jgi:hypothetical protein
MEKAQNLNKELEQYKSESTRLDSENERLTKESNRLKSEHRSHHDDLAYLESQMAGLKRENLALTQMLEQSASVSMRTFLQTGLGSESVDGTHNNDPGVAEVMVDAHGTEVGASFKSRDGGNDISTHGGSFKSLGSIDSSNPNSFVPPPLAPTSPPQTAATVQKSVTADHLEHAQRHTMRLKDNMTRCVCVCVCVCM